MADKETLPEAVAEVMPENNLALNKDKFDAVIAFSERIEKLSAAFQKIRFAVLKQALPGDFVQFGEKLELSGPGAERVRSFLGISFSHWRDWKESGTDKNGDWYTWWYEADAMWQGVVLEKVQGRAGSRDKFFGYEKGAWKELSDVKEADIRTAARRCVIKEGTKLHLGLRGLPVEESVLTALGIDASKINKVEHGKSGASGASGPAPAEERTPILLKNVGQRPFTKKDGTKSVVYVVEDERGTKYETFSESIAKAASALHKAGKKVLLGWEPNGRFAPKLTEVSEAEPTATEPTPPAEDKEPNT